MLARKLRPFKPPISSVNAFPLTTPKKLLAASSEENLPNASGPTNPLELTKE